MENRLRKQSEKKPRLCHFFHIVDYFYFKLLKSNLMSSTSSSNCNVCVCARAPTSAAPKRVCGTFCTFFSFHIYLLLFCCFSQVPRSALNTLNEMFCIAFGEKRGRERQTLHLIDCGCWRNLCVVVTILMMISNENSHCQRFWMKEEKNIDKHVAGGAPLSVCLKAQWCLRLNRSW